MALLSDIIKKYEVEAAKRIAEARRMYGNKEEEENNGNVVILNPWATGRVEKGDMKPVDSIWKARPLPRVQSKIPQVKPDFHDSSTAPQTIQISSIEEKVRHIEQMLDEVKKELAAIKGRI